jgi:hypothetical protein
MGFPHTSWARATQRRFTPWAGSVQKDESPSFGPFATRQDRADPEGAKGPNTVRRNQEGYGRDHESSSHEQQGARTPPEGVSVKQAGTGIH